MSKHDDPNTEEHLRLRNEGVLIRTMVHKTCKGTGAVFLGLRLVGAVVEGGRIVYVERIEQDWAKCGCPPAQFWLKFHPLNVQARLIPHWREEIKAATLKAAREICPTHGYHDMQTDFTNVVKMQEFLKNNGLINPN